MRKYTFIDHYELLALTLYVPKRVNQIAKNCLIAFDSLLSFLPPKRLVDNNLFALDIHQFEPLTYSIDCPGSVCGM